MSSCVDGLIRDGTGFVTAAGFLTAFPRYTAWILVAAVSAAAASAMNTFSAAVNTSAGDGSASTVRSKPIESMYSITGLEVSR